MMVVPEMIVVQELTISQGDKTLARCPELVVLSGAVTAVVGANGSGKTTLLNFIVGMETTVKASYSTCERRYSGVAFVPDNTVNYFASLSPRQVFSFLQGKVACHQDVLTQSLQGLGFKEELLDSRISELSYGERKKVYLALAFLKAADLYVMDEPFAGLDAASQAYVCQRVKELRDAGKSVVVADHNRDLLAQISDKTVELV